MLEFIVGNQENSPLWDTKYTFAGSNIFWNSYCLYMHLELKASDTVQIFSDEIVITIIPQALSALEIQVA